MLAHFQCKICDPSCTYEGYPPPITTFIIEHEKLSYIWISVLIGILILPSIRPFNKKKKSPCYKLSKNNYIFQKVYMYI